MPQNNNRIELLCPAKDAGIGRIAVLNGADAVYIGAPKFGARAAAGSSVEEIAGLCDFASLYNVKVYAALNTCLFEDELAEAKAIIRDLSCAGISGLIIQDMGILRMQLPDIPLIASTQVENSTPEKVRFLESCGFSRVILARELSIEQIREIREQTSVELECFVHGALCVARSGHCYLSRAMGPRSGNRGDCAQCCRKSYSLTDSAGRSLAAEKYLLSLKDLNLTSNLGELLDAGISSFKIEGRLKDAQYIANNTAWYRRRLDELLEERGLCRSSSGESRHHFEPAPEKTFNRGFGNYGLHGKARNIGSIDTPKSKGEYLGQVSRAGCGYFMLDSAAQLAAGDGICFMAAGELYGAYVNRVDGDAIYPHKDIPLVERMAVYRNFDKLFSKALEIPSKRLIDVVFDLNDAGGTLTLTATDEDAVSASVSIELPEEAKNADRALETFRSQLAKLGGTAFSCKGVSIETERACFMPVSAINDLRRQVVDKLISVRKAAFRHGSRKAEDMTFPCPQQRLDYRANVTNSLAEEFYRSRGVTEIEQAAEKRGTLEDRVLMHTKYCVCSELGICAEYKDRGEPLYLTDESGNRFRIDLLCGECGMEIRPA
ncbi:MAG: U32 family peptidase [Phycisphaerae bacterium]